MVDYFPVLNRAVGALDPNTPETRRGVYDRARRALIDGLRSSDPALSDTDLRTQSAALEGAIRQVELQYEVEALRGARPPGAPSRVPPQAAVEVPPPVPPRGVPAAVTPAPTLEPEAQGMAEDASQDRPPLDDDGRKPFRMIAALCVLRSVSDSVGSLDRSPSISARRARSYTPRRVSGVFGSSAPTARLSTGK